MNYLLDTKAVIALLKNEPRIVRKRLRRAAHAGGTVAVSSIVLYELWYGVARSKRQRENSDRLRTFLSGAINVTAFGEEESRIAGELRARLEMAGTPIGPYDVLIAGQAKARKLTLVTHNTTEFTRVPRLKVEDWKGASSSPPAASKLQKSQAKPRAE